MNPAIVAAPRPLSAETPSGSSGAAGAAASEITKEMFLKLLVAQIRNQNPLDPADGVEFLSQLAEFSGLEQMIAIRGELEAIRRALETAPAAGSAEPAPKES